MTSERELEALANAATALDAAAEIIALIVPTNDAIRRCRGHANNLRELARRLQPARVPDGWKLVPVDGLCPDCRYAYNSDACRESHAAAPAAEGGMAEAVAWQRQTSANGSDWTDWQHHDAAERPAVIWTPATLGSSAQPHIARYRPLGVIANPAPESREAVIRAPFGPPYTTDVPQCCENPETCPEPCVQVAEPEAGQREGVEALEIDPRWSRRIRQRLRFDPFSREDIEVIKQFIRMFDENFRFGQFFGCRSRKSENEAVKRRNEQVVDVLKRIGPRIKHVLQIALHAAENRKELDDLTLKAEALARRLARDPQPDMAYTLERMSQDYDTTGRDVEAAALRMAAMLVRREQQRTGSRGEGE